jgi:hypothetical protein
MTQQSAGRAEQQILSRVAEMIASEKALRQQLADGAIDGRTEQERLIALETELDQCWDLLRQRRALAAAGQDPDAAHVRPAAEVEGYLE